MQFYLWIGLNLLLFAILFVVVPFEKIKRLAVYGIVGGIGLAIFIFYFFSGYLKLWDTIGSAHISGVAILPVIAWFPPTIVFGHFYPKNDTFIYQATYVLVFALGAIVAQFLFIQLKMWINYNWNYFYTFLLALAAHSFLAIYIRRIEQRLSKY